MLLYALFDPTFLQAWQNMALFSHEYSSHSLFLYHELQNDAFPHCTGGYLFRYTWAGSVLPRSPGTRGPPRGGVVSGDEDCCSGGGESGGSNLVSTTEGYVMSPSNHLLLSAVDAVLLAFSDGCFNHFRISVIIHRCVSLLWKHFGNDARTAAQRRRSRAPDTICFILYNIFRSLLFFE